MTAWQMAAGMRQVALNETTSHLLGSFFDAFPEPGGAQQ